MGKTVSKFVALVMAIVALVTSELGMVPACSWLIREERRARSIRPVRGPAIRVCLN